MTIEKECRNQAEKLGLGYDSFNDKILSNSAIDYSEEDVHEDTKGHDTFFLQQVQNKQNLGDIFNGSISGSVSALFIPCPVILGGEAKARYFSQINIEEKSAYLFLNYKLIGASRRIINPKLSATAKNLLHETRRNPNEFRRVYGDEFIVGFRKDAEYNALIQIHSSQNEDINEIALEVQAYISSLISHIEGKAQAENKTNQSFENKQTTVYCYKTGVLIEDQSSNAILTIEDMIEDFNQFKKGLAKTGGKENIAFFENYDGLIDRVCPILTPELQNLKSKLNRLRAIKMRKQTKLLEYSNKLRFNPTGSDNHRQEIALLDNSIYDIDNFIRRCAVEPDLINSEQYRRFIDENN